MKYLRGSFSVGPSLGADEQTVADNWERTFGKPGGVPDQQEPVAGREDEAARLRAILQAVTSDKPDSAFDDEQNHWRKLAVEAVERAGWVSPSEAGGLRRIIQNVEQYLDDADAEDLRSATERDLRRILGCGEPVENLWRKP